MGKHSRRKSRAQRKSGGGREPTSAPATDQPTLRTLRHGDAKSKQNLLITLQSTILDASGRTVSLPLLEAVREQLLSASLECAIAAADCLALYLTSPSHLPAKHRDASAGWTLLFLSRVNDCCQGIDRKTAVPHWFALASSCVRALCSLIESNRSAVDRLHGNYPNLWAYTLALLQRAAPVASAQSSSPASQLVASDERTRNHARTACVYAARILHSAIDDNPQMMRTLDGARAWESITSLLSPPPTTPTHQPSFSLPSSAQLHLAGLLVLCRQLGTSSPWKDAVIHTALPVLKQAISEPRIDKLSVIETDYLQAKQIKADQARDSTLERDVLRAVQDRKESAREIARRQKANPRQEKAQFGERIDGEQAFEDAWREWNRSLAPLHLALEVTANLFSCLVRDEESMLTEIDESFNSALDQAVRQKRIVDRLLTLLAQLNEYSTSKQDRDVTLQNDIDTLTAKTLACLSNVALGASSLGDDLIQDSRMESVWNITKRFVDVPGVSATLAVFVRRYSECRTRLLGNDFEFVVWQLLDHRDEQVKIDAVSMLANAVSESGADESRVEAVSVALLKVLRQEPRTVSVVCEVLNGLIDMYSSDDLYVGTFRRLGVLSHFQQAVSWASKQTLSANEEDTLATSTQFIEYKQTH